MLAACCCVRYHAEDLDGNRHAHVSASPTKAHTGLANGNQLQPGHLPAATSADSAHGRAQHADGRPMDPRLHAPEDVAHGSLVMGQASRGQAPLRTSARMLAYSYSQVPEEEDERAQ